MSRIVTFVTCCDSAPLAEEALFYLRSNSTRDLNTIVLIDNGSVEPLPQFDADRVIRYEENIGGNAVFHSVLSEYPDAEVVAFFHCDFMVREPGWDEMVLFAFAADPKLGLVGFLGSNQIDGAGGRGLGTTSSFMGAEYKTGWASKAEIHGKRSRGLEAAAVLDHCSMIFRRSLLEKLPSAVDIHTPGHFYDRILSCEVLSRGFRIATFGLDVDHFSGGIGLAKARVSPDIAEPGVLNRDKLYKRWLTEHNLPYNEENPDTAMYVEGERRYLSKWRDETHFIPLTVNPDYSITHQHPQWSR